MKKIHRKLRIDWWFDENGGHYRVLIPDRRKVSKLAKYTKWQTSAEGHGKGHDFLTKGITDTIKSHIEYDLYCRDVASSKRKKKNEA